MGCELHIYVFGGSLVFMKKMKYSMQKKNLLFLLKIKVKDWQLSLHDVEGKHLLYRICYSTLLKTFKINRLLKLEAPEE